MSQTGRGLQVGWRLLDIGLPPRSPLLNTVPWHPDPVEFTRLHEEWRVKIAADEQRLAREHAQRVVWEPVASDARHRVVPVFGGDVLTRLAMVVTMVNSASCVPNAHVTLLDLENSDLVERLGRARLPWRGMHATLSPRQSNVDAFRTVDLHDLAALVTDLARPENTAAGHETLDRYKQLLLEIGHLVQEPVSLDRLLLAVRVSLTGHCPADSPLSPAEQNRLLALHHTDVSRRGDGVKADLNQLLAHLSTLKQFSLNPGANPPTYFGRGPLLLRVISADSTTGSHDLRTGRQILVRALARQAQRANASTYGSELLIVLGAKHLTPDVVQGLQSSAERNHTRLVLFFDRLAEPPGESLLSVAAYSNVVLLRLSHPSDTKQAAEFLGREHKFVVNGHTVSVGESSEWSTSHTYGYDQSTSRAWTFGMGFGATSTSGSSQSEQTGTSKGKGTSTQTSVSDIRVHEFVVEPEQFATLPDGAALVVEKGVATLTFCDPNIGRLPIARGYP